MEVTAGIFVKDYCILLMRRAPGQSAAGGWEYPGEQCLRRELNEELCIDAEIGEKMAESTFETGSKTIHLHAYRVNRYEGKIQLTVHDQMEWVPLSKLLDHDQLPADYLISQKLLEVLR